MGILLQLGAGCICCGAANFGSANVGSGKGVYGGIGQGWWCSVIIHWSVSLVCGRASANSLCWIGGVISITS